jgi:putative membrane protein
MARPFTDRRLLQPATLDRLERAVAEAEKRTSCELILVVAPQSSKYEGRVLSAAALTALAAYLFVVALNWALLGTTGEPITVLVEAMLAGGAVAIAASRVRTISRWLVPRIRRLEAVDRAAGAAFYEERAAHTRERNAVLVYVSLLEGEVRVLADVGVEARVHEARLNPILARLSNAREGEGAALLEQALMDIALACEAEFPRSGDDANELPDRPVVRLP